MKLELRNQRVAQRAFVAVSRARSRPMRTASMVNSRSAGSHATRGKVGAQIRDQLSDSVRMRIGARHVDSASVPASTGSGPLSANTFGSHWRS
jgi:hypothetical protein